ncbi:MAG: hypothetical protein AAGD35_15290 [Actinomycetota bacterium]
MRKPITMLLAVALAAATLMGPATPAGALDCNDREDRGSVQCHVHGKRQKGGTGKDSFHSRTGIKTEIQDRGGVDRLVLRDVAFGETRFKRSGRDLTLEYRRGRVLIHDHFGSGRIETIEFEDLRFAPAERAKERLAGVRTATAAAAGKGRSATGRDTAAGRAITGDQRKAADRAVGRASEQLLDQVTASEFDHAVAIGQEPSISADLRSAANKAYGDCRACVALNVPKTDFAAEFLTPSVRGGVYPPEVRDMINKRNHRTVSELLSSILCGCTGTWLSGDPSSGSRDGGGGGNSLTRTKDPDRSYCGSCDGRTGGYTDTDENGNSPEDYSGGAG